MRRPAPRRAPPISSALPLTLAWTASSIRPRLPMFARPSRWGGAFARRRPGARRGETLVARAFVRASMAIRTIRMPIRSEPANGDIALCRLGAMMRVTVRIVLERTAGGGGADLEAPVPDPTNVTPIEAAHRGEVIALGGPPEAIAGLDRGDRGPGRQVRRGGGRSAGGRFRHDFRRVARGVDGRACDVLARVRIGSRAGLGPSTLDGFAGSGSQRGDALRARALVLRTEPRRSRVSALAGFDPYRGRPAGLGPVRGPRGSTVDAGPSGGVTARRRCAATVRRRAGKAPVTRACRPARRSLGAADRRPRRAPPGTPCP